MTTTLKSLLLFTLLSSLQFLYAEPASKSLLSKLDSKITYRSEGESIGVQLQKFANTIDIYLDIDSSAQNSLKIKTKKFTYSQIRAKYIFYRLLKEAGLKYKFDGDSVDIYKD